MKELFSQNCSCCKPWRNLPKYGLYRACQRSKEQLCWSYLKFFNSIKRMASVDNLEATVEKSYQCSTIHFKIQYNFSVFKYKVKVQNIWACWGRNMHSAAGAFRRPVASARKRKEASWIRTLRDWVTWSFSSASFCVVKQVTIARKAYLIKYFGNRCLKFDYCKRVVLLKTECSLQRLSWEHTNFRNRYAFKYV